MRKTFALLLLFMTICSTGFSQYRKSVSILGDSYSTFEHYLQPDTNAVWYFPQPLNKNDVTSVGQTWWYKFIQESGYRLCVNNSFSGSTICHTGYQKADYSDRSFVTRMDNLGCPDIILIFGGTNDSWAGAPIGEYQYAAWTKQNVYSGAHPLPLSQCGGVFSAELRPEGGNQRIRKDHLRTLSGALPGVEGYRQAGRTSFGKGYAANR